LKLGSRPFLAVRQAALVAIVMVAGGADAADSPVTFSRQIAPIVSTRCAGCHRPGGGAPFSLLTYQDVRRRATSIGQVTASRYMPPWKPEAGYGDLAGSRRLPDRELELLQQWLRSGMPEGDPADLPPAREQREWQLGTPDLVVTMPEPYQLAAGGADVFRTFVASIPITSVRQVKAIEFHPGTTAAIHHAAIKIDRTDTSRQLDEADPAPGYDGGAPRTASFPDGHFLAWTPGQSPSPLPDDMSWPLEASSDVVFELHLMPTGKPESIQPSVGLFFTDRSPSRRPSMLRLGSQTIDIAAGDSDYRIADSFVLPVAVEVLALQPHAHYLAREVSGFARLPDGTIKWLIYIKDWDFRWQDVYRLHTPLALPAGATLEMNYTYDNSAANVRNPHRPPQRVTFGQTTSSEMGNLWIQVMTATAADRAALDRNYEPQLLAGDIAGGKKMLENAPDDWRLHSDLGLLYVAGGRLTDATIELEAAVRLAPQSPTLHYMLGTVLLTQHRVDEARSELRAAVALNPGLVDAHINLGVASHALSRIDEAIDSYAEALRLRPGNAQAHYNLGRAFLSQGDNVRAVAEYRRSLELKPDDLDCLVSLGSVLALTGQFDESAIYLRRARVIDPQFPGLPAALESLVEAQRRVREGQRH
jgi:tetratricopeptide (TPR) repeat protein